MDAVGQGASRVAATRMNADFSPQRHRDKVSNLAMDGVGQGPSPEGAADL